MYVRMCVENTHTHTYMYARWSWWQFGGSNMDQILHKNSINLFTNGLYHISSKSVDAGQRYYVGSVKLLPSFVADRA
jgi:hypothetical protein